MAKTTDRSGENALSGIAVAGLKSIGERQSLEFRPLTILAGANSSGKSSLMQGLLLLKQTLEAPYDPGPLLIRGPNVAFSSVAQMLHHSGGPRSTAHALGIALSTDDESIDLEFSAASRTAGSPIELKSQTFKMGDFVNTITSSDDDLFIVNSLTNPSSHVHVSTGLNPKSLRGKVVRRRCFLQHSLSHYDRDIRTKDEREFQITSIYFPELFIPSIESVIHLPGLRGNPERTYPLTAIGPQFPGTFENYAASVIAGWAAADDANVQRLGEQMAHLGLTWKVEARAVDDTRVELRVGRLPAARPGGSKDLVSIADVGLGVSQTLPVLVSLLVARPGQLVYIEQPEIHLHPRAQFALAKVVADAANRGVRAVIETHSSLFLLGVQALVAEGELAPEKVKLNWFSRSEKTGATTVRSADLDEAGRFGDWPEDFADVTLDAEGRYLDAVDARLAKGL
jgi:hypothetical protein